jgi:hypothetical protein
MPSSIRSDRRFNRGAYCGSLAEARLEPGEIHLCRREEPAEAVVELARERSLSPLRCICRKFDSEARKNFPTLRRATIRPQLCGVNCPMSAPGDVRLAP